MTTVRPLHSDVHPSDECRAPYLTDQLIAYIGNKRKLLGLIKQALNLTGVKSGVFFDAFSGSGVVARLAKLHGFTTIANDWEPYTGFINRTYISQNHLPQFAAFGGVEAAFNHLNHLPGQSGYISRHYCPADDENPDYNAERMFFTQENGQRLDAMREEVECLRARRQITADEYDVLVAALVFGSSWCSNTSGVFKGFHRGWGGATQTAWYRIRKPVMIRKPILHDNGNTNLTYQEDALALANEIVCDIAYLDPPYNQHQYGANYHLLNTMALWDKPVIPPRFSQEIRGIKAAIRLDWRTKRNSAFCHKSLACEEFQAIVNNLRAKWILVSYSTDGVIPMSRMIEILDAAGSLSWVHRPYKRYRVSSQRPSARGHNLEFVLVVKAGATRNVRARDEILFTCDDIHRQSQLFREGDLSN